MPATAGAIRAGRAFVELFGDNRSLVQALNDSQKRLQAFGAATEAYGKKLLFWGTAAAAPFALAIKTASNLEETMNKFNVVFAGNANAMRAWGREFAQTIGRSDRQILDFLASTQDLLVPIGFSPGHAEQFSMDITKLAIDLASFNNMADADAMRDLHAALTGSGEVMKKYGVIVSEAAVKQQLLNQGLDPKTVTEQQKVMARLTIIMAGTTAAQGDAIRSADAFANQTKRLQAELENLLGTIGQQLLPIVTPLVESFGQWIQRVVALADQHEELIPILAQSTVAVIALGAALIALGTAAKGAAAAMTLFRIASQAVAVIAGVISSPVTVLAGLITAFVGVVLHATGALDGLWESFSNFGDWLGRKLGLFDEANDKLAQMGQNAANAADGIQDAVGGEGGGAAPGAQNPQMDAAGRWHDAGFQGGHRPRPAGVGVLDDLVENLRIRRERAAEARRLANEREKERFLREDAPLIIQDERNPNFIGPASPTGGGVLSPFEQFLSTRSKREEPGDFSRFLGPAAVAGQPTDPRRLERLAAAKRGVDAMHTAGMTSQPTGPAGTFGVLAAQMFAGSAGGDVQKQIKEATAESAKSLKRIERKGGLTFGT